MKTKLIFRKARTADWNPIQSLIKAFPDKLMQSDVPKSREFFVATVDGRVVSCCALAVYSKRLAEVRSLAVSREHQGKGIATTLITLCLKDAQKRNVRGVITITGARVLFEQLGFSTFNNEKYALLCVLPRHSPIPRRG